MSWNGAALILVVLNFFAISLHCGDNVINFSMYPEPTWISGPYIVGGFYAVGIALLMCGYFAFRRRRRWLSSLSLLGYSLISVSALGHYLYAPFSSLTSRINVLILFEAIAALLMIIFVVFSQKYLYRRSGN